jgi:hypothetical protein
LVSPGGAEDFNGVGGFVALSRPDTITVRLKGGGPLFEWFLEQSGEAAVAMCSFKSAQDAEDASRLICARHGYSATVVMP